ncbi:subtilase [Ilyonectria robusta]
MGGSGSQATIYSYKVFGAGDGTYEDIIIEAMLKAFEDDVDVITISIGGRGGWANSVWAVVASRIADEGVVMTIGAGNYGTGGPYYASSGSSGENVLSVASAEVSKDGVGETKQPSYFSSWGGLYDLQVEPDIAAPGTNIFSAWPGLNVNGAIFSGMNSVDPWHWNLCMRGDVLHGLHLGGVAWSLDEAMPAYSHRGGAKGTEEQPAEPKSQSQWQ